MAVISLLTAFVFGLSAQPAIGFDGYAARTCVPEKKVKATTLLERTLQRSIPPAKLPEWDYRHHPFRVTGQATGKQKTDNGEIIREQPEGTIRTYTRTGDCYYSEDFENYEIIDQFGFMDIVYGEDGKSVYLKEFVSVLGGTGVWAKGSLREDSKQIIVPTGQKMLYFSDMDTYLVLNIIKFNAESKQFEVDQEATEITLSIQPDESITLDNTYDEQFVGLSFSHNGQWARFGDFGSVYVPFKDSQVTPPAGLPSQNFILNGSDAYGGQLAQGITLKTDGNDVYLQGIGGYYNATAWAKGSKEGNTITLPGGQFFGIFDGTYPLYMVTANLDSSGNIIPTDLIFTFDESRKLYTTDQVIILADSKEGSNYYDMFRELSLVKGPDITFSTEVISEQPEGEVRLFQRQGKAYTSDRGIVFTTIQDGNVLEITYAPDGETVYLKNPLSQILKNTWVKGTLKNNKLTVPAFQCIAFDAQNNYGGILAKLDLVEKKDESTGETYQTYEPDFAYTEFCFTLNKETGTLSLDELTDEHSIMGVIMTDNFKWPGFGDFATTYSPFNEQITTLPGGLTTTEWAFKYSTTVKDEARLVNVAVDGDKIYISQLSQFTPEATIIGTLKDGKATFKSGQYLGCGLDIFFFFAPATYTTETKEDEFGPYEELVFKSTPELVFDYDETKKILSAPAPKAFLLHCGDNIPVTEEASMTNYYTAALHPEFRIYEEKAIQPMDPKVKKYDDSSWDALGYSWVELNIPLLDVEGGFIKPENMAYQLFIKMGDHVEAYTLYADEYDNLKEDMEIIPYNFTDNYDIMKGGENIVLRQTGFDNIGVQSINYSCGQEIRSNLTWYDKNGSSISEETMPTAQEIQEVSYYNLHGIRLAEPCQGISLKVTLYTDGSTQTTKVYRR